MLKKILAITGRPGLYEIVAQGKNMILVQDISTGRRFPASARDKIVALGDISMYTDDGDTPLGEILDRVYAHFEGKAIDVKGLEKEGKLAETFGEIVPDFDRNRVYNSDIRKLFSWYNLLLAAGFKEFAEKPEEETKTEENESPATEEKAEETK